MPQLMPFYWVLSIFVLMFIVVGMVEFYMNYNSISMLSELSNNMEKEVMWNW